MEFIAQIINILPHKSSTLIIWANVKLCCICMWSIGGQEAALVTYACLSLAKTQHFLWRRAAPGGSLGANQAASNKNHMHAAYSSFWSLRGSYGRDISVFALPAALSWTVVGQICDWFSSRFQFELKPRGFVLFRPWRESKTVALSTWVWIIGLIGN